ncbi:hypothetical protein [Maritimibacter dapengensis]|uniref:Uncharacterized protein n=1 Tax=Maritimibacter dapengensis TaxID=2836868 RepID=A0ABS6SYJ9_9RHOB|nr:hypothetical protein [Maritimibacter dapengensis]MBV7378043.1 hypothetical protein [Maritimibacter dapengensis]
MTGTIAWIAGPYLIATALGFLISRGFYERMVLGNADADPVLLNLSGAVHFIIGAIVLANHWDWSGLGAGAVTLLGVAAVAKGASLIIVPELTLKTPKTVGATLTASSAGFFIWGALLLWVALTGG